MKIILLRENEVVIIGMIKTNKKTNGKNILNHTNNNKKRGKKERNLYLEIETSLNSTSCWLSKLGLWLLWCSEDISCCLWLVHMCF